jgi:hypothetical protein
MVLDQKVKPVANSSLNADGLQIVATERGQTNGR